MKDNKVINLKLPFDSLQENKKVYFVSDFHLGVPTKKLSLEREKLIVSWLKRIEKDASIVFLLGDVFDFWFEYKHVVPKGFFRLFSQLAQMSEKGIMLHYFTGNHDMWARNYLPDEIGLTLHKTCVSFSLNGKRFLVGHGDGLGPGDHGYKMIKRIFANPFCQWLFKWLHPDMGISMANFWSGKSRVTTTEEMYLGDEKEWLVQYCKEQVKVSPVDYFIFGHRHLVIDKSFDEGFRYLNLGEWFHTGHYAEFSGKELKLLAYTEEE